MSARSRRLHGRNACSQQRVHGCAEVCMILYPGCPRNAPVSPTRASLAASCRTLLSLRCSCGAAVPELGRFWCTWHVPMMWALEDPWLLVHSGGMPERPGTKWCGTAPVQVSGDCVFLGSCFQNSHRQVAPPPPPREFYPVCSANSRSGRTPLHLAAEALQLLVSSVSFVTSSPLET